MADTGFRPAWWLPGPHLQTIWPALFRRRRLDAIQRERLELADGDFLDLAWIGDSRNNDAPLVLVLHGLEGSLNSHYAAGILNALRGGGLSAVLMHFRGCSGEPNRLPRSYHSGETGDLAQVLALLARRGRPVAALVGYSLGGNVLLKWLGESGTAAGVRAAVAVSVPFQLADAARRLDRGGSRLYRRYLLNKLARAYRRKWQGRESPLGGVNPGRMRSFWQFDDLVTAPLHGFAGVEDYYRRSSCRQYLRAIRVPTLIVHANDDPFMFAHTAPQPEELAGCIELDLTRRGGHVGFIAGHLPWRPHYWLDHRILDFLRRHLQPTDQPGVMDE